MGSFSGGILLLVGAVLWVGYLFPTILKRRQYAATEQNALKLQQTLRAIAEATETPEEVRVEATARAVLAQQRRLQRLEKQELRANERALAAAAKSHKTEARAARAAARAAAKASPAARARRRRWRAVASLLLLAGLGTAAGGAIALGLGASPWIAIGGGAGALVALTALIGLAGTPSSPAVVEPIARPAAQAFVPVELPETAPSRSWTPQPLPEPLHLAAGSRAAATIASTDAVAALRRAALEVAAAAASRPELPSVAERIRLRESAPAQPAPATARPLAPAAPAAQAASTTAAQPARARSAAEAVAARYAALDPAELAAAAELDVSAVLQRRRAV